MQAQIEPSPISSSAVEPARLVQVPVEAFEKLSGRLLPLLDDVARRSNGRWTVRAMLREFYDGRWQFWVVWDGSLQMLLGTELYTELSGKRFLGIRFATGEGAKRHVHLIDRLEDYARDQGCHAVDGWMRKGWAKHLPEYRLSHVLLERELD